MKLDKDRIAKIKSNIEVDLEFSQEARQECKSFEPFDYNDNTDAFFNTIEEKLKYVIDCLDDCDEGFVRNYAQEILTGLINKAIESSRSYGAFTIKEPEFDITIVVK